MPCLRLLLLACLSSRLAAPAWGQRAATRYYVNQRRFPEARCIDGTPPVYYLRPAPQAEAAAHRRRWLISLQGGSSCTVGASAKWPKDPAYSGAASEALVPLDCADRAQGSLGSSAGDPPEKDVSYKEILSPDPARNPVFHDWNIAFGRYCDGSGWSSATDVVASEESVNRTYHFRGAGNVMGIVQSLLAFHGMGVAEEVILHGCSSGAHGALALGDRVRAALPPRTLFAVLADSAVYFENAHPFAVHDPQIWQKYFDQAVFAAARDSKALGFTDLTHALANYDAHLAPVQPSVLQAVYQARRRTTEWLDNVTVYAECTDFVAFVLGLRPRDTDYICHSPGFQVAFGTVPVFVLNSVYDSWSNFKKDSSVLCGAKETAAKGMLGREAEAQLAWSMEQRQRRLPGVPAWAFFDHCPHHCMRWHELWDSEGRSTNADYVSEWLSSVRSWHTAVVGGAERHDGAPGPESRVRVVWQRRGAPPCAECCGPQCWPERQPPPQGRGRCLSGQGVQCARI